MLELSKEIHDNAVEKGFWNEPNIKRSILLIVSELYEAFEAYRQKDFTSYDIELPLEFPKGKMFETNIKDTFEDEVADVCIRLLDLYEFVGDQTERKPARNLTEQHYINNIDIYDSLAILNDNLLSLYHMNEFELRIYIPEIITMVEKFYNLFDTINTLGQHIKAKMAYNATREYLHGKQF